MFAVSGGCHCGNILLDLRLPREPGTYEPRVCDCDFCRKHHAAYVSDAKASLRIVVRNEREAGRYRQGSGTADFLVCRTCGVLVAVLHASEDVLYGAVNTQAVDSTVSFGPEQPVSPQKLGKEDKVKRWTSLWVADVRVVVSPQSPNL
jgi:hypothetical protein